jgi:tetratricopeptide (TPR) repeat protein
VNPARRILSLMGTDAGDSQTRDRGQGPDEETLRALRASELVGRAEKLLGEGDFAGARALAQEAHELDDTMAEYQALLGYTKAMTDRAELEAGLDLLDEAIRRDPYIAQAFHWRGILRRRLGLEDMAIEDFAKAVELRPSLIDAQREMRASLPPSQRDPTGAHPAASPAKVARPGKPGSQPDARKAVAVVLAAVAVLLALGGGTAAVVDLPTEPQQRIRAMLAQNELKGLDEMGVVAASQIALLLTNGSSAGGKTYRELANEYLLHYAATIDKRPPPDLAKQSAPDWSALKAAWLDWLSHG